MLATILTLLQLALGLDVLAQVPGLLGFQGRVTTNGVPFTGSGTFRFALVNAAGSTSYWSNDGSSTVGNQPTAGVPIAVTRGLYNVLLGDTTLTGMTRSVEATVFTNPDVRLRVWFDDGIHGSQLLAPDQRLAAAGYALVAGEVAANSVTLANLAPGLATSTSTPNTLVLRDINGDTMATSLSLTETLVLRSTSGPGTGLISLGVSPFLHAYGNDNTYLGNDAGNFVQTGVGLNTGIGRNALHSLTTGYANTAVGRQALSSNTTGYWNTGVGVDALESNVDGLFNTAVGTDSLRANTSGHNNTAVGVEALNANVGGWWNTGVGRRALFSNDTGINNTAVGLGAMEVNKGGHENTAVGVYALHFNTEGIWNTAVGVDALKSNTTGSYNSAVGLAALLSNTTGQQNVSMGAYSLHENTQGSGNTAIGTDALQKNLDGFDNTALGFEALYSNTTGVYNTGLGMGALRANTIGWRNTSAGVNSLYANTTGSSNSVVGTDALKNNLTGSFNAALGFEALYSNVDGSGNVAVGLQAMRSLAAGANNVALGNHAGENLTSGNNNIEIGHPGVDGDENTIRLGTPGIHTATYLAGSVFVNGVFLASDRRLKRDVAPIVDTVTTLSALHGVTYCFSSDRPVTENGDESSVHAPVRRYGFVAQEVAGVLPELVRTNATDGLLSVNYIEVIPLLTEAIKQQARQLDERSDRIASLEARLARLEERLLERPSPSESSTTGAR